MVKQAIRWIPAVVWMAVIFALSHQSGDELGTLLPFFQRWFPAMQSFNAGHFAAYFILSLTFYWALLPRSLTWGGKGIVLLLCLLYGLSDEYHQSFVADRTPDIMDWRNDGIGAALALAILSIPAVSRYVSKRFLP
ncbi:VanZ family protein [Paenibacillus sp. HJGM_3]|uniref:VanZ family protein n=1 Tax=Paenibacillus sp. HJGM_3 TaxID=3379816 RepID=UPI003858EBE8